jgi:hypothetical protein
MHQSAPLRDTERSTDRGVLVEILLDLAQNTGASRSGWPYGVRGQAQATPNL